MTKQLKHLMLFLSILSMLVLIAIYDAMGLPEQVYLNDQVRAVSHGDYSTGVLFENGNHVTFNGVQALEKGMFIQVTYTESRLFKERTDWKWRIISEPQ